MRVRKVVAVTVSRLLPRASIEAARCQGSKSIASSFQETLRPEIQRRTGLILVQDGYVADYGQLNQIACK